MIYHRGLNVIFSQSKLSPKQGWPLSKRYSTESRKRSQFIKIRSTKLRLLSDLGNFSLWFQTTCRWSNDGALSFSGFHYDS